MSILAAIVLAFGCALGRLALSTWRTTWKVEAALAAEFIADMARQLQSAGPHRSAA